MAEHIKKDPQIDAYMDRIDLWQEETAKLREIALGCDLTEVMKWNKPCYAYEDKNVVVIQGFKAYIALLFMKGVLLEDPHHLLVKTGENTQVGRQIRFTNIDQITEQEDIIKFYLHQGIEVERLGLKVEVREQTEIELPEELEDFFLQDSRFQEAFEALTPGRQRGYIYHFNGAKQSKTRIDRIEKCIPKIFDGLGFNDR